VAVEERKETDDVAGAARAAQSPIDDGAHDTAADLQPDDGTDSETYDEEPAPPPADIADLAAACVRFIGARYGATLDFDPDTLSFVDQWVRDARAEIARRPEAVDVVQSAAGAYLGEVIRRAFGGTWVTGGEVADWRLCLSRVFCAFNPIGMVREALLLDTADGWHGHFQLDPGERDEIEQRLAALPPVEDDEFFAPSTRFDVTEIVVAALLADMQARGLADVRFGAEDYA
jgi:hypothetical protein